MEQYIAQQILKVKDALVKRDLNEAFHELYKIASPNFDKMSDEVWADIEKAATQPPSAPAVDSQVQKTWDDFWKEIVCSPDGTINIDQVKKELSDFSFLLEQIPAVYMHITGGKMSKVMYRAEDVIKLADNYFNEQLEEAVKDELEDREAASTTQGAVEITQKEMFYYKQIMNPYPTGSQDYTAYEKGFIECFNHFFSRLPVVREGAVWVKASIQLPKVDKEILFVKYDNGNTICNLACLYQHGVFHSAQWGVLPIERVEYLDETGYYKSSYIQEYKQMKEYEKFLGGPDQWTEEKIKSMNQIELLETFRGYQELISFLDDTIYAIEEGSAQWEEKAKMVERQSTPSQNKCELCDNAKQAGYRLCKQCMNSVFESVKKDLGQ
jgi:hypothetical protein